MQEGQHKRHATQMKQRCKKIAAKLVLTLRARAPPPPPACSDVSGLTASLVRQALPCHFRITTETASRSSSMSAMSNRF